MEPRTLRVLEFIPVLEQVAKHCQWQPGREIVLGLTPYQDIDQLHDHQVLVNESIRAAQDSVGYGLGGLSDVRPEIKAASRGQTLEPLDLIRVREVACASRKLSEILRSLGPNFPLLSDRARYLGSFIRLENQVEGSIDKEGKVRDQASPTLAKLRADIRQSEQQIQNHLQDFLRDSEILKVLQEPIVTQRQGRYVLPVKSDSKSRFPGIVIDQSGSGATLFMEPLNVLPLSNRLRADQLAEEREIERILHQLSGQVASDSTALLLACDEMAQLDSLAAQAMYALKVEGHLPEIAENGALKLVRARHPLLVANSFAGGIKPVPISLEFDPAKRILVLTGPNTGGKTVALKTVGLMCLMGLCGLPVPASSQTTLPFLTSIWADIGDDQSIAQSLSTFSAHLTQILRILPNAGPHSLVLLDELGAGTDPTEGAALGVGLLENLHRQRALTLVTTHLSEIKMYASKAEGFENAAVEFDADSLSPTYKVIMGIPGRSNALLIASRLGLPDSILRRARELLGGEQRAVEGLLDDLEREREILREQGRQVSAQQAQTSRMEEEYRDKLRELELYRERILAGAAQEAQELVSQARQRSHSLLRDFRTKIEKLENEKQQIVERCQLELDRLREQETSSSSSADRQEELSWEELERLTRPEVPTAKEPAPGELGLQLGQWPTVQRLISDWSAREQVSETPDNPLQVDAVDQQGRVAARTLEADLEVLKSAFQKHAPELPPKKPKRPDPTKANCAKAPWSIPDVLDKRANWSNLRPTRRK